MQSLVLFCSLGGYRTLLVRIFWLPVASADISECPCTLGFQSPAEVYRSTGQSVVLPEFLKSLELSRVRCVQLICNGLVRVTYNDVVSYNAAMSSGVAFRG